MEMLGKANAAESSSTTSRVGAGACLNMDPFVCPLCAKAFPSAQALGGHQNAHRKERNGMRKLCVEQRLARLKDIILTPKPLRLVPANHDHIFEHYGSNYGPAGSAGSVPVDGYGNLGKAPYNGKVDKKYHRYVKPRHEKSMKFLELTLGTRAEVPTMASVADEYANKAFCGGEDGTEIISTSNGKLDLTLRL